MVFAKKMVILASSLILAGSVFAGKKPICPDINNIKAEGLPMSEEVALGFYFAYNLSNYNTDSLWGFALLPIEATSTEQALEDANNILSNMTAPGVVEEENDEMTLCVYDTGIEAVTGVAIKEKNQITPFALKQYIKRIK